MAETSTATITVMFTDLVDSTRLLQHGAASFDDIRRAHFDALRQALARHRGAEVKSTGDGLMATFTSAADAVAAAEAAQRHVARLRRSDPRSPDVRVGIACGEATNEDGDWYGQPVIEAARLCAAAEPGQILATAVVPALVGRGRGHTFVPRGEVALKGFDHPTAVSEVLWQAAPDAPMPLPPAAASAASGFFVGRTAELDQLRAAWKEAHVGSRRAVLVGGEPGVGKTRLVAELANEAHAEGAVVLWGRCDEELNVAYQPFAEAMRHWADHADTETVETLPDIDALAPLIDAVAGAGPAPSLAAGDGEGERLRLFEAVNAALTAQGDAAPVLLVVDDAHWAAAPTLQLLRFLVADPRPAPILIATTYRDSELDRTHPLAAVLADLRRVPAATRVPVRGLTVDEVSEYLEAAAGEQLGPDATELARAIHAETEGNAFFVGQVLRHLAETGGVTQEDGHWRVVGPIENLGIPEGVREVVGRRLSRLSDTANKVLTVAAVVGRDFDLRTVEMVSGLGDAALDGIDEAVAARLVDEDPTGAGFAFAHALVRQTLLAELTGARRARLHRQVADSLAGRPGVAAARLAHHYCEGAVAGDVRPAVEWSIAAMREAWDRLAYEEGVVLGRRAAPVLELDPDADPALVAGLHIELSLLTQYVGDTEEAKRLAARAIDIARPTGDPGLLAQAVTARYMWARVGVIEPMATAHFEEAIRGLDEVEPLVAARLLITRALERAMNERDGIRAEPFAREAAHAAVTSNDPPTIMLGLFVLASVTLGSPQVGVQLECVSLADEALGRLPESERDRVALDRHRIAVPAMLQVGDRAGAEDAMAGIVRVDSMTGTGRIPTALLSMWRSLLALAEGRLDDADRHAAELVEMSALDVNFQNSWAALVFRIGMERGTAGTFLPIVQGAVDATPDFVAMQVVLAQAAAAAGEIDAASTVFNRLAADGFASVPRDPAWSAVLIQLTELCLVLDATEAAPALYDLLLPFSGQMIVVAWGVFTPGSADRYLGMLALVQGRTGEAHERFRTALALEESMGFTALAAWTRYWTARALAADGDSGAARQLAAAVQADAERMGLVWLATSAADLARAADG